MKSEGKIKEYAFYLLQGFFVAYALCTVSHLPLIAWHFETKLDFVIASVYELLGEYNLPMLVVVGLSFLYFWKVKVLFRTSTNEKNTGFVLFGALFFAFWSIAGRSFYDTNSFSYIFGSVVNFVKSSLMFCGYFLLWKEGFYLGFYLLDLLSKYLNSDVMGKQPVGAKNNLLKKTIIILSVFYVPIVFLSYPGNLCYDSCGQIIQVMTGKYTEHAPLFHTLLMGGVTVLVGKFGSYKLGLFCYCILQVFFLEGAFVWVICKMKKEGIPEKVLVGLSLLYGITPIYSNLVSTPIKDIPFVSFALCYVFCYALICLKPNWLDKKENVVLFVLLQALVTISRNNGFYLVVLSGIPLWIYLTKTKRGEGKAFLYIVKTFFLGAFVGKLLMIAVAGILHAEAGSAGEMLSIPFQQTARYVKNYGPEITDTDIKSLEAVLGDLDVVAMAYDPDISDPVKALYVKTATGKEMVQYFMTWGKLFFRHPGVYFEAFTAHIYGWFCPFVSNSIRYEAAWDEVMPRNTFGEFRHKILVFFYRYVNRISVLGLLENVGVYVWLLFLGTGYYGKKKFAPGKLSLVPMYISLLICMASPCFFKHPRYALPIMMGMPVLLVLCSKFVRGSNIERE